MARAAATALTLRSADAAARVEAQSGDRRTVNEFHLLIAARADDGQTKSSCAPPLAPPAAHNNYCSTRGYFSCLLSSSSATDLYAADQLGRRNTHRHACAIAPRADAAARSNLTGNDQLDALFPCLAWTNSTLKCAANVYLLHANQLKTVLLVACTELRGFNEGFS